MYTLFPTHILRQDDGAIIPLDESNADFQAFLQWQTGGGIPDQPPVPTFEERKSMLLAAVDAHLNAAARAKGYDNIMSASLRAALPNSPFQADGVAFGTWMDLVYAKCYQVLAQVLTDEIPEPTAEELLRMLPELQLPG
jgi:hypothetical protein